MLPFATVPPGRKNCNASETSWNIETLVGECRIYSVDTTVKETLEMDDLRPHYHHLCGHALDQLVFLWLITLDGLMPSKPLRSQYGHGWRHVLHVPPDVHWHVNGIGSANHNKYMYIYTYMCVSICKSTASIYVWHKKTQESIPHGRSSVDPSSMYSTK